jgi:hypothetical protein
MGVQDPPLSPGSSPLWEGEFDDPKVLEAIKAMVVPANEQNIDRLIYALENSSAA